MATPPRTIGAAQLAEVYLDTAATIEKDCSYIQRAGEQGLDLLVFPEFHLGGSPHWHQFDPTRSWEDYYVDLFENAVTVPGPEIDRLCSAAQEAETALVIGANEKVVGTAGTMYNSLVFIDSDGTLLGSRRKLVPTVHERLFHTGGTGADVRTFESSIGTLGGLMCGEHHNPLAVYAMAALGEAYHAAAWPAFAWWDRDTRDRRINVRTRYHAMSGGVPTVSAVGVVDEALADALDQPDWVGTGGGSTVISATGEYLTDPRWETEGLVSATIDPQSRTRAKATLDVLGHYNRFDVFSLELDRRDRPPIRLHDDDRSTSKRRSGPADGVRDPDRPWKQPVSDRHDESSAADG